MTCHWRAFFNPGAVPPAGRLPRRWPSRPAPLAPHDAVGQQHWADVRRDGRAPPRDYFGGDVRHAAADAARAPHRPCTGGRRPYAGGDRDAANDFFFTCADQAVHHRRLIHRFGVLVS